MTTIILDERGVDRSDALRLWSTDWRSEVFRVQVERQDDVNDETVLLIGKQPYKTIPGVLLTAIGAPDTFVLTAQCYGEYATVFLSFEAFKTAGHPVPLREGTNIVHDTIKSIKGLKEVMKPAVIKLPGVQRYSRDYDNLELHD